MAQNGSELPRMDQNCSMARNGSEWRRMVQNGSEWLRTIQNRNTGFAMVPPTWFQPDDIARLVVHRFSNRVRGSYMFTSATFSVTAGWEGVGRGQGMGLFSV